MMTENKRFIIKPQDDLFGITDNDTADKMNVINGIRTEIETKWLCDLLNELDKENQQLKQFKQQVINLIDEKIIFVDTCNQNYKLSNDYYRGALDILELLKKELSQ